MIPKITTSTVYSKLGDNSSLVPLAIKDIANSCGLTAASYMSGDKAEGKDRFIDEFGTQAIWLWGIPAYKKVLDSVLFKSAKLDPEVDARIIKNKDILNLAQKMAPNDAIKNSLKAVAENQGKFKALTIAKFAASTILTAGTYLGLTKFRHNYTEAKIKKDYFEKMKNQKMNWYNTEDIPFSASFSHIHNPKNKNKNIAFTGGIQDFVFDPVKNLMLVDGTITGERLTHAKNPQDFLGYVIKEGFFWAFMYFAGPTLANALEKLADKKGTSIDLDSRVIFGKDLEKAFKGKDLGIMPKQIQEFKNAAKSDVELYKFAVKPENKNLIIKMAKDSGIITLMQDSNLVDTRKYIDLKELKGICDKAEKLFTQYKKSEKSLDEFLKSVRSLKKASIIKNIGACIGALGIIAPAIMLGLRKLNPDYQVRKDIEKKLANQQA